MVKYKSKLTSDLNDGEMFKFKGDSTNYKVIDYVYYSKVGSKKKKLLPFKTYVQTFKTI